MASTVRDRQAVDAAALLEYIGALPPPGARTTLVGLNDGYRLWQILQVVDPDFFSGDLPEPSASDKWLSRWQNLKHVYKALTAYITSRGARVPDGPGSVDLKSIAEGKDKSTETIKLLKLVLFATVNSPRNNDYVQKMMALSSVSQVAMMGIYQALDASSTTDEDQDGDTPAAPTLPVDQELLFEERYVKAMAEMDKLAKEKKDLQKELRDFDIRNSRLQENNAALQQRLIEAEDRLKKDSTRTAGETVIKQLESRVQQRDDVIASQEAQLVEFQEQSDRLQAENNKLRKASDRLQPLQDELDELRIQRDGLVKKANTLDKYKQKLQATQDLEKENQILRGELNEIRQIHGEGDKSKQQIAGLQKTVDEYKNLLPGIERDRHELQMMLRQLEHDNASLVQRLDSATEQQARSQEMLAEFSKLGADGEAGAQSLGGLALELESSEGRASDLEVDGMHSEWTGLTSLGRPRDLSEKNQELTRTSEEATAKAFMLQQMLDDAKKRNAELEAKLTEGYTGKAGGDATVETADGIKGEAQAGTLEKHIAELSDSIEDGSGRLARRAEAARPEQEPSKEPRDGPAPPPDGRPDGQRPQQTPATTRQEVENLKRELRLMTTAFHGLSGRMQLNNMVVLHMRNEGPKGFLGRQRLLVSQATAVRTR